MILNNNYSPIVIIIDVMVVVFIYLYGVGYVPRCLPFVDLVPAPAKLSATRRVLVEAAVVHAKRLRRPLDDTFAIHAAVAFLHATVRRQFRVARGPERVRVRFAATLQPVPLGVPAVRRPGSGRRRGPRRPVAAAFHDSFHTWAVLGHVRLDGGPHHVHGGPKRWHVKPTEIGHRKPLQLRWRPTYLAIRNDCNRCSDNICCTCARCYHGP